MGVEVPKPGSLAFQAMLRSVLHSKGVFLSGERPSAEGPRHCGQLEACATSTIKAVRRMVQPRECMRANLCVG